MRVPENERTTGLKNLTPMLWFLVTIAAFLLAGCAAGNYGYVKRSRDVTRAFETFQVYPEHRGGSLKRDHTG
jgi:hypothetical protein